jgi:4-hydroxy-tetrahydrodipicolinate reductase
VLEDTADMHATVLLERSSTENHDLVREAEFDVLIDFTRPEASLYYVTLCCELERPLVVGTTGFTEAQRMDLEAAAQSIPILVSPNMSIGVHACLKLLSDLGPMLGDQVNVGIMDYHHQHKRDQPSGTALKMGAALNLPGIQYASFRLGEHIGEHRVILDLPGEVIEITHRAENRRIFAEGAVRAARWLLNKKPGLYTMADVLS